MIAHTGLAVRNFEAAKRFYDPGYYAAFVYDLDGHNIEAVWYDYDAEKRAAG